MTAADADREASRSLGDLDERLRRRQKAMEEFGYPPKEIRAIRNARLAVRGASVSVYPGNNYDLFHWNLRQARSDLLGVPSVAGVDRDRWQLAEIEAHWEAERDREERGDDDRPRRPSDEHEVRAHERVTGSQVRRHRQRNPRKR